MFFCFNSFRFNKLIQLIDWGYGQIKKHISRSSTLKNYARGHFVGRGAFWVWIGVEFLKIGSIIFGQHHNQRFQLIFKEKIIL